MKHRISGRQIRRILTTATVGAVAAVASAGPANAHLPVILTEANTACALATGPYVPDGTVSFAFYGWLERPRDTRAARIHLGAGQQFNVQILIPDLAPENTLRRDRLPQLTVIDPRGAVRCVPSTGRVAFAEPYSNTNYLILSETLEPSDGGTYSLIVTGRAAARFVLVTGTVEQRTAALQNATIADIAEVLDWYTHPDPPGTGAVSAAVTGLAGRVGATAAGGGRA